MTSAYGCKKNIINDRYGKKYKSITHTVEILANQIGSNYWLFQGNDNSLHITLQENGYRCYNDADKY